MLLLIELDYTEPVGTLTKKPVMTRTPQWLNDAQDHLDGEWDGDEYNGWRFIPYNAEDEQPETVEQPEEEVKVWVARSQPRDQETGAVAFDISFNVGTEKESISRVPIQALMDLEDNSFPYEEVTEAVNDWIEKAKRFPHTRRNCLCCWNKATKGKVLCKGCNTDFGELIYAE
jgi:hypothetical protein